MVLALLVLALIGAGFADGADNLRVKAACIVI
jgi:hypothetical protein